MWCSCTTGDWFRSPWYHGQRFSGLWSQGKEKVWGLCSSAGHGLRYLKTNVCELYKDGQQMPCEHFPNCAVLAAARAVIEGFPHNYYVTVIVKFVRVRVKLLTSWSSHLGLRHPFNTFDTAFEIGDIVL